MNELFQTPVLLIVFNRPDLTAKLWAEVKKIKPTVLYVAADGPRANNQSDLVNCQKVREVITKDINWPCDTHFLFQEKNLGCGLAIKSALSWFFEDVIEGIILEDDCLPHPDFFSFCHELLERYRQEEKVFMISGNSVPGDYGDKLEADYYFTYTPSAWGWASWKRSLDKYDFYLDSLEQFKKDQTITKIFTKKSQQNYWLDFFQEIKDQQINNWDYQLAFTSFKELGLCLRPKHNLISNLGMTLANGGVKSILNDNGLKIGKYPRDVQADAKADEIVMNALISPIYRLKKILKKIKLFYTFKKISKKIK